MNVEYYSALHVSCSGRAAPTVNLSTLGHRVRYLTDRMSEAVIAKQTAWTMNASYQGCIHYAVNTVKFRHPAVKVNSAISLIAYEVAHVTLFHSKECRPVHYCHPDSRQSKFTPRLIHSIQSRQMIIGT